MDQPAAIVDEILHAFAKRRRVVIPGKFSHRLTAWAHPPASEEHGPPRRGRNRKATQSEVRLKGGFMYHAIVKHITRNTFERLNQRDFESILKDCAPNIRHRFGGTHALAATVMIARLGPLVRALSPAAARPEVHRARYLGKGPAPQHDSDCAVDQHGFASEWVHLREPWRPCSQDSMGEDRRARRQRGLGRGSRSAEDARRVRDGRSVRGTDCQLPVQPSFCNIEAFRMDLKSVSSPVGIAACVNAPSALNVASP